MTEPVWWRLTMAAPAELEESLLWKLPCLGIRRLALRHRPGSPLEQELVAWLPAIDWPQAQRGALADSLRPLAATFGLELPALHWTPQADEDWSTSWKQHWQPDPVGQRLLILPAWLEAPADQAGRLQIRLDPGSAFGTGSHPSTRLCLEALEQLAGSRPQGLSGLRVADLGCGSGILGLAALRLGAASVAAADIDPMAVRASQANAALNGLELMLATGSSSELAALLEQRPADLLLCNILAPVIDALAPDFSRLLTPGGMGLLSGLLVEQAADLQRRLAGCGWQTELTASQDAWGLLSLRAAADVA
ncbi:MAG: 50S ribosomal protein L11 methyltransferase [Cyanobacteriota bacterium]|nr:50S ribosomal protein L11 methyltransferase [Cyanobacteriota bacterium]